MPRVRRKAKQRRAAWTPRHVEHLLTGFDFFDGGFGIDAACDYRSMLDAWTELQGELLPAWIAEHAGCRPFAWWAFSAPERRKRIDGGGHPFDNPRRRRWLDEHRIAGDTDNHLCGPYQLFFGVPSALCGLSDFDNCIEYETEADYLGRLGLLADFEREAIRGRIAV